MKVNNTTKLYLSVSSMPGNFGMTIYNELFNRYKLNYLYLGRKIEIAETLIDALKVFDVKGCSVSMPLKNEVVKYLDELSEEASAVSSVNTIVNKGDKLIGYNTDLIGFRNSFEYASIKSVLVYGSGSVVDSIIFELQQRKVDIYITGRNIKLVTDKATEWGIKVYSNEDYDVFVNATPVSLVPLDSDLLGILNNGKSVFDLVVKKNTFLSEYCANENKSFTSGFEMYKHQFCAQFELYTNIKISTTTVEEIAYSNNLMK
jgi:shikimate dehydrogenase